MSKVEIDENDPEVRTQDTTYVTGQFILRLSLSCSKETVVVKM
jgi:hypothetical protein